MYFYIFFDTRREGGLTASPLSATIIEKNHAGGQPAETVPRGTGNGSEKFCLPIRQRAVPRNGKETTVAGAVPEKEYV